MGDDRNMLGESPCIYMVLFKARLIVLSFFFRLQTIKHRNETTVFYTIGMYYK